MDLVQICPRLERKFHNCSLERNTAQIMSFTSVSLHLGTGWYNIGPAFVDSAKRYPEDQKVPEEDIKMQ